MDTSARSWLTGRGARRVPAITAFFWLVKSLTTALGESTSDYLVHAWPPVVAVLAGFAAFLAALTWQFSVRRYRAWPYWLAVAMVGVFGTMAADVLHVALGVPYAVSAPTFAVLLATVFVLWYRTEGTLSIHAVDSPRREAFYWAAVVATFALGTAVGDLTAITLHLGYTGSVVLFAALISVPMVGYRWLRWNAVLAFWTAYVLTRPLGASVADWLGKPVHAGGLGVGAGPVSLLLTALIAGLVTYLVLSRADVPEGDAAHRGGTHSPTRDRAPGRAARSPEQSLIRP